METEIGINISNSDNNDTFDETVKQYIVENDPKLYILTPCYGGTCYISYLQCLINTLNLFRLYNFPIQVEFCKNDSLVSRARNNLIAKAMHDPKCSHIIFIDNDITWNPVCILKLIITNKPLIGGAYPIKRYNWEKLTPENSYDEAVINRWIDKKNKNTSLKESMTDVDMIQSSLLRYNINYISKYIQIENNLTEVKHIATGFMLMQRAMIEKMMIAYHSTKYTDDVNFLTGTENNYAYALFDCGVEDDHYLSEDWLFCNRWRKIGGSIWLDVTINLTHTGTEDYNGSFISSIL
jgi:hypothetical protein